MVPLTIPADERRITLRSFWFLISLAFAVPVSVVANLVGVVWWAVGIAALVAVGSLVLYNEHLVRRLYRAWNNRIIRPLSSLAIAVILKVCLLVVFAATGRVGQRLQIRNSSRTM